MRVHLNEYNIHRLIPNSKKAKRLKADSVIQLDCTSAFIRTLMESNFGFFMFNNKIVYVQQWVLGILFVIGIKIAGLKRSYL